MLIPATHAGGVTTVETPPSTCAVVSWNAAADAARIALRVRCSDGRTSALLPYVEFAPATRRSLDGADDVARIATDVVTAGAPITALDIACDAPLELAVSTPPPAPAHRAPRTVAPLDVPVCSQYVAEAPHERGWCSPAALSMLLAYCGRPRAVADIARGVYDDAYGGTGNWAFNTAYAATQGLRAVVVHLDGLAHAALFLAAGMPLALTYAWRDGGLPDAPLPSSDGHFGVLRGLDEAAAIVNDPAHPRGTVRYAYAPFERAWQEHGGVAYGVVTPERAGELVRLANA